MTDARYRVYARDADRRRLGELPDYGQLKLELRFNDVGGFHLTCPVGSRAATLLHETGGIIVTRDLLDGNGPHVVFSGFVRDISPDASQVEIAGVSDEWVLDVRAASPDPASEGTPGDAWATEQDIRSGTASTVMIAYVRNNAGDLALPSRRVPGLTVLADPGLGSTVYGQARLISLLALMQELALAGGGLRFQVVWQDGELVFSIGEPAERSVVISRGRGTLGDWRRSFSRATATRVYSLGQGQGVNRQVVQATNATTTTRYGFSIEAVVDRRDTNDTLLLAQEASNVLAEGDETRLVAFTPLDTPSFRWGVDYDLGDLVTVVTGDGEQLREVVRGVDITLSAPGGSSPVAEVQPIVSTPGDTADDPTSRQQRAVNRRVGNLERNIDSLAAVLAIQWNVGDLRMTTRAAAAAGWLLCDGQAVSRVTYAVLFGILGTTYGSGDGSTTFNVPDLRERVPIGKSGTKALGSTGGSATTDASHSHLAGTLTVPNHQHAAGTLAGPGHQHATPAHQHAAGTLTVPNHQHAAGTLAGPSHTHTGPDHAHAAGTLAGPSHGHTAGTLAGPSHAHAAGTLAGPSHDHSGAALSITGSTGAASAETNNLKTISPEEADASTKDHTHGVGTLDVAGNVDASGTGSVTGSTATGGTGGVTGAVDLGGTGGVTGSTASDGTGATGTGGTGPVTGSTATDGTATVAGSTASDGSGTSGAAGTGAVTGSTANDGTGAVTGLTGSTAIPALDVQNPYLAVTYEIYAGV